MPKERTLKLALDMARVHSLAILETVLFLLQEWAADAEGIDLLDGTECSSSAPENVAADIDHAVLLSANNRLDRPTRKQHARSHLVRHRLAGRLASEHAASYVLGERCLR